MASLAGTTPGRYDLFMGENYVVLAVPFFFVLMAIEYAIVRWQGKDYYRLGDAINSVSCGLLSQLCDAALGVAPYVALYAFVGQYVFLKLDTSSA